MDNETNNSMPAHGKSHCDCPESYHAGESHYSNTAKQSKATVTRIASGHPASMEQSAVVPEPSTALKAPSCYAGSNDAKITHAVDTVFRSMGKAQASHPKSQGEKWTTKQTTSRLRMASHTVTVLSLIMQEQATTATQQIKAEQSKAKQSHSHAHRIWAPRVHGKICRGTRTINGLKSTIMLRGLQRCQAHPNSWNFSFAAATCVGRCTFQPAPNIQVLWAVCVIMKTQRINTCQRQESKKRREVPPAHQTQLPARLCICTGADRDTNFPEICNGVLHKKLYA